LFFFWHKRNGGGGWSAAAFCICAVAWLFATAMERSGMRIAMCHSAVALQKV